MLIVVFALDGAASPGAAGARYSAVRAQDGAGGDEPVCSQLCWQEPDQRGEDGAVGPVEPGEEAWTTAEILILRHQLAVLQRRQPRRPNPDWADRALLATLLAVISKARRQALRLPVTPDTVLRWRRDIVCRRWPPGPGAAGVLPSQLLHERTDLGWNC